MWRAAVLFRVSLSVPLLFFVAGGWRRAAAAVVVCTALPSIGASYTYYY